MVVLMLIPDTFSDRMTSVVSGLCILGISLMFIFLNFLFPNEGKRIILLKLYPLFAVLPVLYCFLCRMSSMLKSVSYLAMSISGWEMFLYTINVVYAIISTGSILFAAIAVSEYTIGHKWLAIVSVLLSCSLLAVLIVRSITGGPIIKYDANGNPSGESDINKTAFLCEKGKSNEVMFNRMSRYVEENKPFLNPNYTLENLARDLTSNKTYVSRLINDCTGLNFCQLMNRYRVNFAREMFQKDTDLKVRDLSEISGFNSQVSFNMAFKLFYSVTPGLWCKDYKDKIRKPLSTREESER